MTTTPAHPAEIAELQAEIDRLRAEVDRLTEIGGSREPDGPPPFVLTPPSEEYRALYQRLDLHPGAIGPAWKEIRVGVCPSCKGKLTGNGGEDDPWRYCPRCGLAWAAEPASFGVRED